jgi:hypothetical protein
VSIAAIGAGIAILHPALKEHGIGGLLLFLPPIFVIYSFFRWQRCKYPFLTLVACLALAAVLQRARLGYWAWPDVELAA